MDYAARSNSPRSSLRTQGPITTGRRFNTTCRLFFSNTSFSAYGSLRSQGHNGFADTTNAY
jgi:hypothetical protein